jgi:hypothetical protein
MKSLATFGFIFILLSSLSARIWVVNNTPGSTAADYISIQSAIDNAQDGDTLFVQGSSVAYGTIIIEKQLAIFGPGYFLAENDSTQANKYAARTNYIYFNPGSENSVMCGMSPGHIVHITNVDSIKLFRNNIKISFTSSIIQLQNAKYCVIMQNYIRCTADIGYGISLSNSSNYNLIKNNCIDLKSPNSKSIISLENCINNIVQNNVANGQIELYQSEISNNILVFGSYIGTGNTLINNMCNGIQFKDLGQNNLINVDMTTAFVDTGSTDGQWQIKSGGPADGTGTNGTDMGMFGGNDPYVLSGIPPLPAIFEFYGTNAGAINFPVQIKIKARD